jgi:hypothetical protein
MSAPPFFDPATLGTDLNLGMNDIAGVWGLATGLQNFANAIVRRLSCPPGGLFYDDEYGYDVQGLINASLSAADVASAQGSIVEQVEKDERTDNCRAAVVHVRQLETVFIVLFIRIVTGQEFSLVIAADKVNVFLLALDGQQVAGTSAIGAAAAAAGAPVQLLVGPPGQQGIQGEAGATGASGTPQLVLDFDEGTGNSMSGDEDVVYQRLVNFDALQATITFELVANVFSEAGTAVFRMSYGGTDRAADGTQVGSDMSTASATPVPLSVSAAISNPTGVRLVKITAESSGAGVLCSIQDRTLTIR